MSRSRTRFTWRWRVATRQANTIPVTDGTPADPEIVKLAEPYDRETRAFLSRVIGHSDAELSLKEFRDRDTAILDPVHRVQLDAGVKRELWKDFFVALSLYNSYDNRPPNPAANTNDVGVVLSIGWTY